MKSQPALTANINPLPEGWQALTNERAYRNLWHRPLDLQRFVDNRAVYPRLSTEVSGKPVGKHGITPLE